MLSLLSLVLAATFAQVKPPEVSALFPAGGAPGQTVEVTASGSFESWPVRVWTDEAGVRFEPKEEKGKFTATIAPDAPPGIRRLRFHSDRGASSLRAFLVGSVPETTEAEPNDGPEEVQAVESLPVTLNGRLQKRNDVDAFRVSLKRGQTLVALLDAQSIGSPMDGVLQVVDPTGFVAEQADDSPLLDPRLDFVASTDGDYLIRVFAFPSTPDSSIAFAGGDAFVYRLTLTTGPALDGLALPLMVDIEGPGLIEPLGWNVPPGTRLKVASGGVPGRVRAWQPGWPGLIELPLVESPSPVEPSRESEADLPVLSIPGRISGRIGEPGEEDRHRMTLTKGQVVRLKASARRLGSELDPVVRVVDAEGKVLAEQDDSTGVDAELSFTAPADGSYNVVVFDLVGQGGPRAAYLLEAVVPRPDFSLSLASDRLTIEPGKTMEIDVTVNRQDGFDGAILVEMAGLPPGVKASSARSEAKGDSARKVRVKLEADASVAPSSGPVFVIGRAGGLVRPARASPGDAGGTAVDPWLTVLPASGK